MRRNLSLNRTSGVSLAIFIAVYQPKVFIHRFWVSPAGFHSDFEVRSGNIALPVDIVNVEQLTGNEVRLINVSTTIEKTLVDPGSIAPRPLMNYWPFVGASYTYSNALSSDQQ